MPAEYTYDYAIIRVVPRVERGERINVGVILSCVDVEFLEARIELDEPRLLALDPALDIDAMRANLAIIPARVPRRRRRRPDRRAAAARPFPLAGVAAQHDDPDVAGAHRSDAGSRRGTGEAGRSDGATAAGRQLRVIMRLRSACSASARSHRRRTELFVVITAFRQNPSFGSPNGADAPQRGR